jgi:pimeloyl-ACP methyl ester carboxylesterase
MIDGGGEPAFTPAHRGGSGPPLVCLHGFTGSWHVWELVLDRLERHHDVFAPTLPGHRGGPELPDPLTTEAFLDVVEGSLDAAGITTAHLVGNSLGGYVALRLAARGRAESVVALAPAGGWAAADDALADTLQRFVAWQEQFRRLAPRVDAIAATPAGRRRILSVMTEHTEHIPPQLAIRQLLATATCSGLHPLNALARREGYSLDAARVGCPVRVVWGTADRLLPWPDTAERYRRDWLPHADWVTLDDVGHSPQLDVPLEAAQLIVGHIGLSGRGA